MIEEDIQELSEKLSKLETILRFFGRQFVKEPIPHTESCINTKRDAIASCGWYCGTCSCDSDTMNDFLDLPQQPVLKASEFKKLTKQYKDKQAKVKRKKAKKK